MIPTTRVYTAHTGMIQSPWRQLEVDHCFLLLITVRRQVSRRMGYGQHYGRRVDINDMDVRVALASKFTTVVDSACSKLPCLATPGSFYSATGLVRGLGP